MPDSRYDILFEPVQIGPKTLPNRFFQTAHCLGAGSEKPGFQAHFRAMKAQGGWGGVSTEYCSVAPESDDIPLVSARLWHDDDVTNLSLLCDLLHEQGALAAVELYHGGAKAAALESRIPTRGASQIPVPSDAQLPPDGSRRHPRSPAAVRRCGDPSPPGRLRHHHHLRRPHHGTAPPVPAVVLQQAHRRLRRIL